MTWNELKLKVDTYLKENNIDDVEIDFIEISDGEFVTISVDEYGMIINE